MDIGSVPSSAPSRLKLDASIPSSPPTGNAAPRTRRPPPPPRPPARPPPLVALGYRCSEDALATQPLLPSLPDRLQDRPAEFFAEGPKPPPSLQVVGLPVGARLACPVEVAARDPFELRRGGQPGAGLGPPLPRLHRVRAGGPDPP